MKNPKVTSIILSVLMIVCLFTACGGSAPATDAGSAAAPAAPASSKADAPAPSASAEKIQLTVGIWPEDTNTDEIKLHEGYKAALEAKYPNVEVIPAAYTYALDTFVPLAESGNLPVIFQPWFTEPQKLIKNDYVRDVTDLLAARGWDTAINPAIKEILTANGKLYGMPRDGYGLGLMCNVSMFEAAGLVNADDTVQYPKTWDEFGETAKKIKDATGKAGLCLLAKDNAGGWHFSNIMWAFGANPLCISNADGSFTPNLNTPEAIAAMEMVRALKWEYDVLTADPLSEDWGTGFQQLGTGNAAMYIAANDAVQQPTENAGLAVDKLSLVPLPSGKGGQFMLFGGTTYMFARDASDDQVNAALDYLEIMGKSPSLSDDSIAGMEADAQSLVSRGVPVINRFPVWVNQDRIDKEHEINAKYQNVNSALYADYFAASQKPGVLHTEEPGLVQDMYAELTKVLQAVITDENADIPSLMATVQSNYQAILDANK